MTYTDVSWKHMVTANLVWVCVYIYMVYVYYIDDIYQVYTVHIHGIFQAYAHVTNMPGIYPLHTSWVCSVPFFIIISLWYARYILELVTWAYAWDIPCIWTVHTWYISWIYQTYIWIYQVYTIFILVYTIDIACTSCFQGFVELIGHPLRPCTA